jgi:hypothetical protein
MMIRRAQNIRSALQASWRKATPKTRRSIFQYLYSNASSPVHFCSSSHLNAMQVFRVWNSAQRTQLSTFILARYPYNTSLTKMSPRQDRLADGPFKLIETPVYAQKSTVSLLVPVSWILLRDKLEAIWFIHRSCQHYGIGAQCHYPWSQ